MKIKEQLERWGVAALGALALGASCDERDIEAGLNTPIAPPPQESVVFVEIDVTGVGWVPIPVPQEGIERLARKWCAYDNNVCTRDPVATEYYTADFDPSALLDPTLPVCNDVVCRERSELCAGFLLEEIARSPVPKVLDAMSNGIARFELDSNLLAIPENVLKTKLTNAGADPNTTTTTKIQFQPMRAPSRAAALRGALNRYRESGLIGHAIQEPSYYGSNPICLQTLVDESTINNLGIQDEDGHWITVADRYYAAFADAAHQFAAVLPRTIEAMRDSAELQRTELTDEANGVATQWAGNVDSALAIANLLGFGSGGEGEPQAMIVAARGARGERAAITGDAPLTPPGGPQKLLSIAGACGENHKASDIGPQGIPVCPPITGNEDTNKALTKFWSLQTKWSAANPVDDLGAAINGNLIQLGIINSPLSNEEAIETQGLTQDGVAKAAAYQCMQSKVTGTFLLPQSGTSPYQKYFGTHKPSGTLPAAALTSHFTGAEGVFQSKIGSSYAKGGAIRTADFLKKTASNLATDAGASAVVSPKLVEALAGVFESLKIAAGKRRLEFAIGYESPPGAVTQIQMVIHGASADEQYFMVSGEKGLRCAAEGSINGQPCEPDDYLLDLNGIATYVSTPDPRMTDLEGGQFQIAGEIHTMPQPGGATAIVPDEGLYVLRQEGAQLVPFGGVVPKPGPIGIDLPPELSWMESGETTRLVIAPVGGTLEQVLQQALTPNSDDCSKVQTTCAGLPADIWPPLESELVGDGNPTEQPFEKSWRYYLDLARQAALEADNLGEELVDHGLKMDVEAKEAKEELIKLCGTDPGGCGSELSTGQNGPETEWGTLGDKDVCLWAIKGKVCDYSKLPEATATPCPLPIPANTPATNAPNGGSCQAAAEQFADLNQLLGSTPADVTFIPVTYTLGYTTAESGLAEDKPCSAFDKLRYSSDDILNALDPKDGQLKRHEFIRKYIKPRFDFSSVQTIATKLRYVEDFADHYVLRNGGSIVFDTKRQGGPGSALPNVAPCQIGPDDVGTGSKFWGQNGIACFVSGVSWCPPTQPPAGHEYDGLDGCGQSSPSQISLDTEREALRRRWAWGFGELRRSMATLGFLTGELSNTMELMRVVNPTNISSFSNPLTLHFNDAAGYPPFLTAGNEPTWLYHTGSGNKVSVQRCVWPLTTNSGTSAVGVGGDTFRKHTGRPVNQNGFLPNSLTYWITGPDIINGGSAGLLVSTNFPLLCPDGVTCQVGGVDPQMPYCEAIHPDLIDDWLSNPSGFAYEALDGGTVGTYFAVPLGLQSNAYIGVSVAQPVELKINSDWMSTIKDALWLDPGGNFCDAAELGTPADGKSAPVGAVWKALCYAPGDDSLHTDNPSVMASAEFMTRAEIPEGKRGYVFMDAAQVGKLLTPLSKSDAKYGQLLFDLRKTSAVNSVTEAPFQYPLTQRNIFDALELACHADARVRGPSGTQCEQVDAKNLPTDNLDALAGALDCLKQRAARHAERFAIGPLTKQAVLALKKDGVLSTTSGLGGQYLDELKNQMDALQQIEDGYRAIKNAGDALSLAVLKLREVKTSEEAFDEGFEAKRASAMLRGYAMALGELSKTVGVIGGGLAVAPASAATAALHMEATYYDLKSLDADAKAQKAGNNQTRIDIMAQMLKEIEIARGGVGEIASAMNALTSASADIKAVAAEASQAKANTKFLDYAGSDKSNPLHFNIAMRRVYNTKLLRYEQAFSRAKKLAFLARRAIELRFGVDLQRMSSDLTLVEAPKKWANDICTMTGIDYADIRSPKDADAGAAGWITEPGKLPPPDDAFANKFIGDYVQKLDDFTKSYPIDYPLKDSDDIAVVSLADDMWQISAACVVPGANLLYHSTEFDKGAASAGEPTQLGWYVGGCGLYLPADGGADGGVDAGDAEAGSGAEWVGCIGVEPTFALPQQDGDAGLPDGGPGNVTGQGLPGGAIAYRVRNQPCIPSQSPNGEPVTCPDQSTYTASGYLGQWVGELETGTYRASVYALADSNAVFQSGNAPSVRVVRVSDGVVVANQVLSGLLTTGWTRISVAFETVSGTAYRFEVLPSSQPQSLDSADGGVPTWPAVFVAAAQLERVGKGVDGEAAGVSEWVKTDASRETVDPLCYSVKGPAFRRHFTRRCEYICAEGIQKNCAAMNNNSVPESCFYEAHFGISLEGVESGAIIPSGQIALGNFNFRHNQSGLNVIGTGVASCDGKATSCFYNGFLEYSLIHSGIAKIRNYEGGSLPATLDTAVVEHGKALAAERVITNPPSSMDMSLMESYMKREYKGRPIEGLYTLRIWDKPGLQWDAIDDIQLVWKYHYWTRFQKAK